MVNTSEQIKRYTSLWRETNVLYEEWARRHGLSYCELLVALSLSKEDGICRQKDICAQWLLPKQTVNTILKNYAERSLITLVPSEKDRRNKEISLTEAGKQFVTGISMSLHTHECAVFDRLGEERSRLLIDITTMYNELFQETDINENI